MPVGWIRRFGTYGMPRYAALAEAPCWQPHLVRETPPIRGRRCAGGPSRRPQRLGIEPQKHSNGATRRARWRYGTVVLHEFEAIERRAPKVASALRDEVAAVLGCKALCLRDLGRLEESLVTCDEAIRQFDVNDPADAVASVLITRSRVLRELERTVEEMEAYAELARRFGPGDELPTHARVLLAESRVLNAEHLFHLERPDESIAEFEKLVEHFGESPVADIRGRGGIRTVPEGDRTE